MAKLVLDNHRLILRLDNIPEDLTDIEFYLFLHSGIGSKLRGYEVTDDGFDLAPDFPGVTDRNVIEFDRYARILEVVNLVVKSPAPMVCAVKDGTRTVMAESLQIDHNLLRPFMDNISVLQSPDHAITQYKYDKIGDVAAFTHVYNEGDMLLVWERYHKKQFGAENVFIIDHGSNDGSIERLGDRRNVVTLPHGKLDHWNMTAFCGYFQRFLLTQYKKVIHLDCDEFLVLKDDPDGLRDYVLSLPDGEHHVPEVAYELYHDPDNEPPIDFSRPITSQRTYLKSNTRFIKPAVTSRWASWEPGFHSAQEKGFRTAPGLWMIHARQIDFDDCLRKDKNWLGLAQTEIDKMIYTKERTQNDELRQAFREMIEASEERMPAWLEGVF